MSSLQANLDKCRSNVTTPLIMKNKAVKGAQRPIFIVDDDASVRDSLRVLLETLGFTVHTYGSGSEFLAGGRGKDAGCLIVDQHMPETDGLTMLSLLRGEGVNAPAILMTGRLDAAIAGRAAELDVTAVLDKPFRPAQLVETVLTSLRRG